MLRRAISVTRWEPTNPDAPVTNVVFNKNTPSINSSVLTTFLKEKAKFLVATTWRQKLKF
jgi:hypothetical protein